MASLHYYIIKSGKGLRSANFIRLWAIPFPPRRDGTVKLVFENFLEMVFCRAFQSLPAATLEQTFAPCPQGQYAGTGLNVISPLLQGIGLSTAPLHDYNEGGRVISVPWGLRETGFQESNSLVWPFDLRKYAHIPGTFQVTPSRPDDCNILRDATQKLILVADSELLLCGDVQDIILPHGAEKVTLTLCDVAYDTWIETKKEKVTRIFIRAPIPLSELRSSHGRQSFELTNSLLGRVSLG
jgi:hypothetical protein